MKHYGPHDEADAPAVVTVLPAGTWPIEEQRPVPEVLLKQRRRINEIAHLRGSEA